MSAQRTLAELRECVAAIVCECGEIDRADLSAGESFHRDGIDSLVAVHIAYEVGLLAEQDIPSQIVTEYDTVEKLAAYVAGLQGETP